MSGSDRLYRALAVMTGVLATVLSGCQRAEPDERPPRIVLVVVDMLRADRLGCYGGAAATPVLDSLAESGLMHPHAVSAFHQTTMSMAAMFTGVTPSLEGRRPKKPLPWNSRTWCGMVRFSDAGDEACVPGSLTTVAETLSQQGYWTAGVSSNGLLFDPLGYSQGFDRWDEVGLSTEGRGRPTLAHVKMRTSVDVNKAVVTVLDERPHDRFFLYIHYMDVHDYGHFRGNYDKAVGVVDAAIGEMLGELESRGLRDDTVVIVTGDHGERLGEKHALEGRPSHQGNPSFETLLRVPLIVAPRPEVPIAPVFRGQDTRYLIEELAGVKSPRPKVLEPEEVFLSEAEFRTYRRYPFKGMWRRSDGRFYLFDIEADRGEKKDLAKRRPGLALRTKQRMHELGASLRSERKVSSELSESDKDRLRALGYLQ